MDGRQRITIPHIDYLNKCWKAPKEQSKMENADKLVTKGTQDEEPPPQKKQEHTTQYALYTNTHKKTPKGK